MSEIQDEAYSELCEENERLKAEIKGLKKLNLMTDDEVILNLKAEIERLREQLRKVLSR